MICHTVTMSNENLVCSNAKGEFKDVVVIGKFQIPLSQICFVCIIFAILHLYFSMAFSSIGNGPSAITLSYLLSGHVPYYRGNSSDDFLHLRLSENIEQPLVLQDLEFLSDVSYFTIQRLSSTYSSLNQLFRDWKADQPILYLCYLTRQHIQMQIWELNNLPIWSGNSEMTSK